MTNKVVIQVEHYRNYHIEYKRNLATKEISYWIDLDKSFWSTDGFRALSVAIADAHNTIDEWECMAGMVGIV